MEKNSYYLWPLHVSIPIKELWPPHLSLCEAAMASKQISPREGGMAFMHLSTDEGGMVPTMSVSVMGAWLLCKSVKTLAHLNVTFIPQITDNILSFCHE